jgi:membrane protein YqaA with SNARE-associated domain
MPAGKFKISLNDESKAIATITTFLSAVIQKVPSEIGIKEYLLILSGFLGYFLYHLGASCKNFFTAHIKSEFSLWYASYRIKKYMKEFNEERLNPNTSQERIAQIDAELKNYRDLLNQKRLDTLK